MSSSQCIYIMSFLPPRHHRDTPGVPIYIEPVCDEVWLRTGKHCLCCYGDANYIDKSNNYGPRLIRVSGLRFSSGLVFILADIHEPLFSLGEHPTLPFYIVT